MKDALIFIEGKNRTDEISSFRELSKTVRIKFKNNAQEYNYGRSKVEIYHCLRTIDLTNHEWVVYYKHELVSDATEFCDYGYYVRVSRLHKKPIVDLALRFTREKDILSSNSAMDNLQYLKETAEAISIITNQGKNILKDQYRKIVSIPENTVLAQYFIPDVTKIARRNEKPLIFPFGLNQTQKQAVEHAFTSQISLIQGPPGTGKTQTILNIIANAVLRNQTVAVVSYNNSATENVFEKLEKYGLSFLAARLGSGDNKETFIANQSGQYPDRASWQKGTSEVTRLHKEVEDLVAKLTEMLAKKNRIAAIKQELISLQPEDQYFKSYLQEQGRHEAFEVPQSYTSQKLLQLLLERELYENTDRRPNWLKNIFLRIRYSSLAAKVFDGSFEDVSLALKNSFYALRKYELGEELNALESALENYHFDEQMKILSEKSFELFRAELVKRYNKKTRRKFTADDIYKNGEEFTDEYPIVLSSTYSIAKTLDSKVMYDYLIIDEASQTDVVTGVLALSKAKAVVIVGDRKQLPNVITNQDFKKANEIFAKYNLEPYYHYASGSFLSTVTECWSFAPTVMLKEHYRCHPKIANFFSKKFYNNDLIIMTEDCGETNVIRVYITVPGNHARKHYNQRQIDVIEQEVIPSLYEEGLYEIGLIAPYRIQAEALKNQLPGLEADTIHKYQGREREAIVLSTVDNEVTTFSDDPNLLNVAVSRAKKSIQIVISEDVFRQHGNINDFVRYIQYQNFEMRKSSVRSIFDMLYKQYEVQRKAFLAKKKKVSGYDSENLMFAMIEKVLQIEQFQNLTCTVHVPLRELIQDFTHLSEEEQKFARHHQTHLDFIIYHKMDSQPILSIEVDGYGYHYNKEEQEIRDQKKNSILEKIKLPFLRCGTHQSGECERIIGALKQATNHRNCRDYAIEVEGEAQWCRSVCSTVK